jgi:hypothetical protein
MWIYLLIWIPFLVTYYKKRKKFRDTYKEITSSIW